MASLTWNDVGNLTVGTTTTGTYNYDTTTYSTITSGWPDWGYAPSGIQYRNIYYDEPGQAWHLNVDCIGGAAWDEKSGEYWIDLVAKGVGEIRLKMRESDVETLLSLLDKRFNAPTDADMNGFFDPE